MCRSERREAERVLQNSLAGLSGLYEGKYYSLVTMSPVDMQQLIDDHFLFQKPTGALILNAGMARDWPDGRGIWLVYGVGE